MLLSTTLERLETCRLVSQYPAIREFILNRVVRTISSGGIKYTGAEENELKSVINLFIPYEKDSDIKYGTTLGYYVKGPYTLHIEQGEGFPISHSLRITRNTQN